MQVVVQKWGNSLGVRIPAIWARENDIRGGSVVEVIVENDKITIFPQKKTLESLMSQVTEENLHSEIGTGGAVGNEEW